MTILPTITLIMELLFWILRNHIGVGATNTTNNI